MDSNKAENMADQVKQIFIQNPQFSDILDDISDCREFSDGVHEPDCMIVVGGTGSGRTTIMTSTYTKTRAQKQKTALLSRSYQPLFHLIRPL